MKRLVAGSMLGVLAGAVLLAGPQEAEACGGFFCDGGPQPMPVDQTGEDIIFVMDEGEVEVHIRIEYEGEAENFAWLIPVLSVPTDFNVSSEALFDNVKAASVPTYGITNQADDCSMDDEFGSDSDAASGGDGESAGGTGDPTEGDGPVVLAEAQVGAYDITVIGADEGGEVTAQEVFDWLADNGYQQDEAALPIIEEYLSENHSFAAIKLVGGADVDELHPIALKFDHPEACVPIRLTQIAAVDDMDIRTYFLSDDRVVPSTYKHVLVNPLKIDWTSQASNYKEVITRAVDADQANGRAFVTEYAGPSDVVATFGLFADSWNAAVFTEIPAVQVVSELTDQGLFGCDYDFTIDADVCRGLHPMVDPLLADFLVPEGVDAQDFYRDPAAYADQIDAVRWNDGVEFSQRLDERVIAPGSNAAGVLQSHGYLTRMYTTISPEEMTADPMFYENADLDDVPNVRTATNRVLCNGDSVWGLPDGREVYVPAGESWPNIGGDEFWEEEVDEMPAAGAAMVLVDNSQQINTLLRAYNTERGWVGSDDNGGVEGGEAAEEEADLASGGCGCTSDEPGSGAAWALGMMFGLGVARRRRTRRA